MNDQSVLFEALSHLKPSPCLQAGDTWAGEGGDAKKGADVISYLKGLHEGR